jgi:tRNA (cytidine/uridine-2'-O-)-methyltransferase
MRLALYQPDIPQNTGTILRMAACFGVGVDIILPTGFDSTDRSLRRAGLDYLDHVEIMRHDDWAAFRAAIAATIPPPRLVLLTTKADTAYHDFVFRPDDIILLGRESAGVPDSLHSEIATRIRIPVRPGLRSLNIAIAAAIGLGEALRQTGRLPTPS